MKFDTLRGAVSPGQTRRIGSPECAIRASSEGAPRDRFAPRHGLAGTGRANLPRPEHANQETLTSHTVPA